MAKAAATTKDLATPSLDPLTGAPTTLHNGGDNGSDDAGGSRGATEVEAAEIPQGGGSEAETEEANLTWASKSYNSNCNRGDSSCNQVLTHTVTTDPDDEHVNRLAKTVPSY